MRYTTQRKELVDVLNPQGGQTMKNNTKGDEDDQTMTSTGR